MQNLIKKILEMDEEARKVTDKAKKEKEMSQQVIEKESEEIHKKYILDVNEKIQLKRKEAQSIIEKEEKRIKSEQKIISDKLDSDYKNNGDKWVNNIVNEVLKNS